MNSDVLMRGMFDGLLRALLLAWPMWLLIGAIYAVTIALRLWEKQRLAASGIDDIDAMSGRTFEKYLEVLFQKLGYQVELTRSTGDYGGDLVVRKDGVKTVIQAKRHRRSIGVKAVQEAVAAKGYYRCTEAMVVSNSRYTTPAVELARANGVTLWDRDRLVAALLSVRDVSAPEPVAPIISAPPPASHATPAAPPEPELAPDRCATCGGAISEKVRAYCAERPEWFGGQVYCYDHQRRARGRRATPRAQVGGEPPAHSRE